MISTIAAIGLGGAFGAIARHFVNITSFKFFGDGFPWGTLTVNVLGSFAMGALIMVFAHFWQPGPQVKSFLITGFLGAFTTFSTFSLDASTLWERGELTTTAFYVIGSVTLSIAALFLAMALIRNIIS